MSIVETTFQAEMQGRDAESRQAQQELSVLQWAVEGAKQETLSAICSNWAALDRAERWWLYRQGIVNESWRRATRYALGG